MVATINGIRECVEGATATLLMGGRVLQEAVTDTFGDFKFDALDAASGQYLVRIAHETLGTASVGAAAGQTCVLGEIELPPFNGQLPSRPHGRHGDQEPRARPDNEGVPVAVTIGAGSAI